MSRRLRRRLGRRSQPECQFRGRDNRKIRYAVMVAAAVHGGIELVLLDEDRLLGDRHFWNYPAWPR